MPGYSGNRPKPVSGPLRTIQECFVLPINLQTQKNPFKSMQ